MDPVHITTALILVALIVKPEYLKPFRSRLGRLALLALVVGLSQLHIGLGLLAAVMVSRVLHCPRRAHIPCRQADRLNLEHLMRSRDSYMHPTVHRADDIPETDIPEKYTFL